MAYTATKFTVGTDWLTDARPPQEKIDAPTPASRYWTAYHGWKQLPKVDGREIKRLKMTIDALRKPYSPGLTIVLRAIPF